MINMLNELKTFGNDSGYFEIKRIGDFPNASNEGYSHINIEAIDFDATTKIFCHELGLEFVKSCDALDIVGDKNKINFIEFKQLPDDETLIETIEGFLLPKKITDSRDILLGIIKKKEFIYEDKEDEFHNCEKNVIISFHLLRDGTKSHLIAFRCYQIQTTIEEQFEGNGYIEGENIKGPFCILMTKFNQQYPKYA